MREKCKSRWKYLVDGHVVAAALCSGREEVNRWGPRAVPGIGGS